MGGTRARLFAQRFGALGGPIYQSVGMGVPGILRHIGLRSRPPPLCGSSVGRVLRGAGCARIAATAGRRRRASVEHDDGRAVGRQTSALRRPPLDLQHSDAVATLPSFLGKPRGAHQE